MNPDGQGALDALNTLLKIGFPVGGQQVTVTDLLVAVAILTVAWSTSRLLRRAIERVLTARGVGDTGTVLATTRIAHYAIMGVALLTVLGQLGIRLSALFAAGAVFAVGVGFALRSLSENFVAGVILLFERSITPGDVLEVNGALVRVERMAMRTALCRSQEDEQIIVPNSVLVSNTVKNLTLHDSLLRLRVPVGVALDSDVTAVIEVLQTRASSLPWRSQEREPTVFVAEFAASRINFEVSVWIDDPWVAPQRRSDLMHEAWAALRDNGVTIAFPQLDVHMVPPAPEARPRPPAAG